MRILTGSVALLLCTAAYHRHQASPVMAESAKRFLASLTPEQKKKAMFEFPDAERYNWHFIPKERKGLTLREMTPEQRHLAQSLLSAGLSQQGFIKATTIMSMESILREMENDNGERRNPEKYHFSIFGNPSDTELWGYRVEGHHLSLNFTLRNGKVMASPNFFGTNPAEVRQGPRKGLRVLGTEEDLGRELYMALDAQQRKTALVTEKAYPDIITGASRRVDMKGQPNGLSAKNMNGKQREMLNTLLQRYCDDLPVQVADARMEQVKRAGNNLYFVWAGQPDLGKPHYFRVLSDTFLMEYDNTQNDANHVHTVWRDFAGDFGDDLLKSHYEQVPHTVVAARR